MSRRNVKLTIAYDGSGYHGWQRQERQIITVQQVLENCMARVVKHPVSLRASGRTDTGVHASGQVANFSTDTPIPSQRLHHAINTRLPGDIRIKRAEDINDTFDAIASAQSKLYRYRVFNHAHLPPQAEKYCYHYYGPCAVPPMHQAAKLLLGEHDFKSFESTGNERENTVRTMLRCHVARKYHWINFDVEATGFLYHMVRNIVGTLLEVGRGHWPPQRMVELLAARDRRQAGPMVPPNGLSLQWVRY